MDQITGVPNGYRYVRVTIDVDHERSQQFWGRVREFSEANKITEVCYDKNLLYRIWLT